VEEVFELNMQLEEARMNKKIGEYDKNLAHDLEQTRANLDAKYNNLMEELRGYWKEWDQMEDRMSSGEEVGAERKTILNEMLDLLNRRTYIRNLVRDVNEVLEI
jgi:molecular chaperone HscB